MARFTQHSWLEDCRCWAWARLPADKWVLVCRISVLLCVNTQVPHLCSAKPDATARHQVRTPAAQWEMFPLPLWGLRNDYTGYKEGPADWAPAGWPSWEDSDEQRLTLPFLGHSASQYFRPWQHLLTPSSTVSCPKPGSTDLHRPLLPPVQTSDVSMWCIYWLKQKECLLSPNPHLKYTPTPKTDVWWEIL